MPQDHTPDAVPKSVELVASAAEEHGFALLGITAAQASPYAGHVRKWLADGHHGEMGYLADTLETRLDPTKFLPGAKAIIAIADQHASHPPASPPPPGPMGRIARYAWNDDYHKTIKRRLHVLADALRMRWPASQFRGCVDTAPVLEREHAARAGLGWIGKHTLLIHPRLGSWFLLGQIVTTHGFDDISPTPVADHCGTCTRCIDACPTDCIAPEGYTLDATRCISYLTLEHRSSITPSLHSAMGAWVAGCDVCQEVCPFNRPQEKSPAEPIPVPDPTADEPQRPLHQLDLIEVLGWGAEDRTRAFRRSALKRIKLDPLRRNALIALGNHVPTCHPTEAKRLLTLIRSMVADPNETALVRSTAEQVLQRVAPPDTPSSPPSC